ncbi:MAG: hypothetical protein ACK57W_04785 [Flavobacteriales bacterium]
MNRSICILCVTFFGLNLQAISQSGMPLSREGYEKLIEKTRELFDGEEYFIALKYTSYIGHQTSQPFDSELGSIWRCRKNYYSDLMGVISFQDQHARVCVNEELNELILMDPDFEIDQSVMKLFYDNMFTLADSIRFRDDEGGTLVRFYLSDKTEYLFQELAVGANGMPSRITIYYRDEVALYPEKENSPKDYPTVVIDFLEVSQIAALPADKAFSQFVKRSGRDFVPSGIYQQYKIVDYRISK